MAKCVFYDMLEVINLKKPEVNFAIGESECLRKRVPPVAAYRSETCIVPSSMVDGCVAK